MAEEAQSSPISVHERAPAAGRGDAMSDGKHVVATFSQRSQFGRASTIVTPTGLHVVQLVAYLERQYPAVLDVFAALLDEFIRKQERKPPR
jgi:hypothetical protein